jgi:hypothetical protein
MVFLHVSAKTKKKITCWIPLAANRTPNRTPVRTQNRTCRRPLKQKVGNANSPFLLFQLLHQTVVDTAVVFPHKMGYPYKRALRMLAAELLMRIIQNSGKIA